jgi:hypothetical protein
MSDETVFHLENGQVAAYLDRAIPPADRLAVEAHLAECDACRAEVVALAGVLRTAPQRRAWTIPASLAAAAAVLVLVVPGVIRSGFFAPDRHREPAVTTTVAPTAIMPRGDMNAVRELMWSAVPRAGRYRVVLLDHGGTLVWRTETPDTAVSIPDSVRLRAGVPYFWKVEAETGFGRWVASDLVDFVVGGRPR